MSTKLSIFFFITCCIALSISSCTKEESCAEDRTYEWNSDTLLVPYKGYENLKFKIVDSTGTLLDSVEYIGEGTSKKRVLDGENDYLECSNGIFYFHPIKDWVYYNKSSPKDKLYISVIIDFVSSDIKISLTENINTYRIPNSYDNLGYSIRYNHNAIADTTILGKQYYNLVELYTPDEQRINGKILISLFSKDYGIVTIEENHNRFWVISK